MVLACLSVFRPITWVLSAYMEAESKTNRLMFLEIGKAVALIGGIALLRGYGLQVAAGAVGGAFGLTAVAGVAMVVREGPRPLVLFMGFMRPLAACGVMGLAVWGIHQLLHSFDIDQPAILVASMIVVGAIAYVASALVIARETSRDLLSLVKQAIKRS